MRNAPNNHRMKGVRSRAALVLLLLHPATGLAQVSTGAVVDGGTAAPTSDAPVTTQPDGAFSAQRAIINYTGKTLAVQGGCWLSEKTCVETGAKLEGYRARIARLEEAALTKVDPVVLAILGVGIAAGLTLGLATGYLLWHGVAR